MKMNMKNEQLVSLETLQYIADHIFSLKRGQRLNDFLHGCDIPSELLKGDIKDADSLYSLLKKLPNSREQGDYILLSIIGKSAHPLMYNGNKQKADTVQEEYNALLKLDGWQLIDYKIHGLSPEETQEDEKIRLKEIGDDINALQQVIKGCCIEEASLILLAYPILLRIIVLHFERLPDVNITMDQFYSDLIASFNKASKTLIEKIIQNSTEEKTGYSMFGYIDSQMISDLIYLPFTNLYTAETELKEISQKTNMPEIETFKEVVTKINGYYGELRETINISTDDIKITDQLKKQLNKANTFLNLLSPPNKDRFCWIESGTFHIMLNSGRPKSVDFEVRSEGVFMLNLFEIFFSHWEQYGNKVLSKKIIVERLSERTKGLSSDKGDGFLRYTIKNIRAKIKAKGLFDIVFLSDFQKKDQGWYLDITNPYIKYSLNTRLQN